MCIDFGTKPQNIPTWTVMRIPYKHHVAQMWKDIDIAEISGVLQRRT